MADRIFPNNRDVDMGSKISFSGIDWNNVESIMKNNRYSQNSEEASELQRLLDQISAEDGEFGDNSMGGPEADLAPVSPMGDGMPPVGGEMGDGMPPVGGELGEDMTLDDGTMDEDYDGDSPTFEPPFTDKFSPSSGFDGGDEKGALRDAFSSSRKMTKVAFTHPDQISAEAIERAQASGDEALVKTILSARKANRARIASKISSNIKLSKTASGYNKYDMETLEKMASTFGDNVPEGLRKAMNNKKVNLEFTSPTKFSQAQRSAFQKIASDLGMPSEYVKAMCQPIISSDVTKLNEEIKAVFSSKISDKTKNSLITSLIKEAKLSPDSKSEFVHYWNDVLGYQDKSFWPDVAANYEDDKKVN